MKLKYIVILFFLNSSLLISKPVNTTDKSLTILYFCNLNGRIDFDEDGRKGLSTIAEIKRKELEKIYSEKGKVLLLTQGVFFSNPEQYSSFKLLKTSLFDTVLLSEDELKYLEKNPNLLKLELPVIANRENTLDLETEKFFDMEGIKVNISNFLIKKIPHNSSDVPQLHLVFPENNLETEIENVPQKIPVIYFLPKEKTHSLSYVKNVYTAECPESLDKIGKIKLTYRNGELIRQYQEFISLNTKKSSGAWIKPYKPTLDEIQK